MSAKATKAVGNQVKEVEVVIPAAKLLPAEFGVVGTAPYVQNRFSAKAKEEIRATQEAGQAARSRRKREPKDFAALYEAALYRADEGWHGIPATAFKAALVESCRLTPMKMNHMKQAIFIEADGFDREDGTPLVRITEGEPEPCEYAVRNANGSADIRVRPMWRKWAARLRIVFDDDIVHLSDVMNLLYRAGIQVGVGEGRPASKRSNVGMGWGLFTVETDGR